MSRTHSPSELRHLNDELIQDTFPRLATIAKPYSSKSVAKVYLYGCDDACDSSEGHKILSKSARELCSMGLVEFSDLDIIDPDYHIEDNEDYWKKHLNNEQFTVTDFFNWLEDNTSTFYDTIEDKDNNINFWRWVKGCKLVDNTIEKLPVLPIYLGSGEYVDSDDIIYLSDDYIEEGGLETIVKKYHPEASFISAEYISSALSKLLSSIFIPASFQNTYL